MGAYLNTPIREKESADKETKTLRYGASSMQGWRMSQEDAHNCCPDFDTETKTALFAVYDGHGGAEVAQYTADHLPQFIQNMSLYKEGRLAQALEEAFLEFDETLTKNDVIQQLRELAGVEEQPRAEDSDDDETERDKLFEEAAMPIDKLMERYGGNPPKPGELRVWRKKENIQSPAIRPKDTSLSFPDGKQGEKDCEGEGDPFDGDIKTNLESKLVNGHSDKVEKVQDDVTSTESKPDIDRTGSSSNSDAVEEDKVCTNTKGTDSVEDTACPKAEVKPECAKPDSSSCGENETGAVQGSPNKQPEKSQSGSEVQGSSTSTVTAEGEVGSSSSSSEAQGSSSVNTEQGSSSAPPAEGAGSSSASSGGSSSTPAAGSAGGSSSQSPQGSKSSQSEPEAGSSTGRTRKHRKGVIPEEGEDESSFDEDEETTDEEELDSEEEQWDSEAEDGESEEDDVEMEGFPPKFNEEEGEEEEEEEEEMEEFMGGGEEPGSDSGCTAVVALLRERELFVANAGDSRCIVCRNGKAIDMSLDHKPEDALELNRITKAGGCVTMDGRVNGGLNLSRAIGDHCYKQNNSLPLKEQMITSLPDIKCLSLEPTDEFMVLACDGIWNVMSSQDVVNFVRERIQGGATKLSAICEEMFEACMAPDTSGDGTGCDNMTCVIISFDKLHQKSAGDGGAEEEEEEAGGLKRRADSSGADSEGFDMPEAKKARTQEENQGEEENKAAAASNSTGPSDSNGKPQEKKD